MNKRLSQISSEELKKLCSDVDSWASQDHRDEKLKEFTCRIRGSIAAALAPSQAERQPACAQAYDPCAAAPPPTASNGGASCSAPPSTCTATVGELQTCLQEMSGAIDDLLAVLPTCEMVATTTGSPVAAALTKIPASCQTLNSKCAGWDKLPGSSPSTQR